MKRLLKRAAGTLGLRVSYTALTFVTSVILARLLGADGLGTYTYSVSWAYLLAIPATMGFDGLISRELAVYQTRYAWNHMSGLIRWANVLAIIGSITLAGSAATIWYLRQDGDSPEVLLSFWMAMIALPFMSLRNIRRGAMRGLHRIVFGLMPEMLVAPTLSLALICLAAVWLKGEFSAVWAVGAYATATVVTLVMSALLLERSIPFNVRRAFPYYYRIDWVKQAWPFMFLESIHVINARADILMLGSINGPEAAGIYAPVNRGAQLIVFILLAFNSPLSPTIASLYAEGKREELQRTLGKAARICLLVSALTTTVMLVFGRQYLLIFGPEFDEGLNALRILCIGRVLYVFVGLSSTVLSMTGFAQLTAATSVVSATINISLNAILIPRYGVSGAAFATTSGVIISGIIDNILVYRKIGILPNILGRA